MRSMLPLSVVALLAAVAVAGCDDDDPGENTGRPCETVDDCYPGIDQTTLQGAVVCMDRVPGGYCTHNCVTDADCCAVAGECDTEFPQVCAPFESTGQYYCFLSCEDAADEAAWCHEGAGDYFNCRSTGGGTDNRKVCVP
jgi:hypothetical protein